MVPTENRLGTGAKDWRMKRLATKLDNLCHVCHLDGSVRATGQTIFLKILHVTAVMGKTKLITAKRTENGMPISEKYHADHRGQGRSSQ